MKKFDRDRAKTNNTPVATTTKVNKDKSGVSIVEGKYSGVMSNNTPSATTTRFINMNQVYLLLRPNIEEW